METRLIFNAVGGRLRVEVTERTFIDGGSLVRGEWPTRTEIAYTVKGAGIRDGSLYTDRFSRAEMIEAAIACYRRHRPKARLNITHMSDGVFGTESAS